MADQAWTFEHIEFGACNELRMRPTRAGEADRGVSAGARDHRFRRPGDEFDVDEPPPVTAPHAELRSIRDRPLGAEVEGSAPTSLIDRK
jgi:hypothetical protein